jgi:hypothetical protein
MNRYPEYRAEYRNIAANASKRLRGIRPLMSTINQTKSAAMKNPPVTVFSTIAAGIERMSRKSTESRPTRPGLNETSTGYS